MAGSATLAFNCVGLDSLNVGLNSVGPVPEAARLHHWFSQSFDSSCAEDPDPGSTDLILLSRIKYSVFFSEIFQYFIKFS